MKGGLDNNGQPGTKTRPNRSSAYTIAAESNPMGDVSGRQTQLVVIDDPSPLAIDPERNLAYMLADTESDAASVEPGSPATPLFLVRVDLSQSGFWCEPDRRHRWQYVLESRLRCDPIAVAPFLRD